MSQSSSSNTISPSPHRSPHTPFRSLTPVMSTLTHIHRQPTRDDGLDNFPPPVPSSPHALERRLTEDPDLERQMAVNDLDVGPPPEGGREAWLCVASAFFVLFCVFGFVTSMGQLEKYYLVNQLAGYSKSTVAWIATCQSTLTFFGSIIAGRFFDSHGARTLVIAGTTLSIGSLIALAFCKEYYQFLLAHAAFGISGSILYSPATAVSGHWFLRKRSTAVGIVVCGSGLGGVIYPIMLQQLFDRLSFRNAILIVAGMNAVLTLPSWWFMKGRLPPRTPPPLNHLLRPWSEARYAFLVIGAGAFMLNFFSPYFYAPTLASANNLPSNISNYSIAILQAGSFVGRGVAGVLADKFGVWNVFGTMSFASSIVIFAFWTGSPISTAATVVGMVAFGFTSGAWLTLVSASTAAISPTREFGMRLGMLWSTVSIPILVGPVVCGVLISANGNKYTYAGIFCGFSFLLGSILVILPRLLEVLRNWRGSTGSEDVEESSEK